MCNSTANINTVGYNSQYLIDIWSYMFVQMVVKVRMMKKLRGNFKIMKWKQMFVFPLKQVYVRSEPVAGSVGVINGLLWDKCAARHLHYQLFPERTAMGGTLLHCTALHCTALYRTALHCNGRHITELRGRKALTSAAPTLPGDIGGPLTWPAGFNVSNKYAVWTVLRTGRPKHGHNDHRPAAEKGPYVFRTFLMSD
jgi:hypothetical protein